MLNPYTLSHPHLLRYIGRTKAMLGSNTNEPVRVLVYGQSISKQAWWLYVRQALLERYPNANLDMRNTAIGGFHSTRLIRCVEQDVREFYPDLVIFHDYGPEEDYEAIIRIIRRYTTAEIAVQTDHYVEGQDNIWHDQHCNIWLPQLCADHHLALIDVRANWLAYLAQSGEKAGSLLRDNVHLNEAGNHLMAEIVMAHWDAAPGHNPDAAEMVRTVYDGIDFVQRDGLLDYEFCGNRIDLLCQLEAEACTVDVKVDGDVPSKLKESLIIGSPWIQRNESRPYRVGMPVRILPLENIEADHWYLDVTAVLDNGREIGFAVHSDKCGFQGSGVSSGVFESHNRAIRIVPEDWFVRETPEFFQNLVAVEVGDRVQWRISVIGHDTVNLPQPMPVTLFQGGLTDTHHVRLHVTTHQYPKYPIQALRIYRPMIFDKDY